MNKFLTGLLLAVLVLAVGTGCQNEVSGDPGTITVTTINLDLTGSSDQWDLYATAIAVGGDPLEESSRLAVAAEEEIPEATTEVTFVLEEKDASGDPSGTHKEFDGGDAMIVFIFLDENNSEDAESGELAGVKNVKVDGDMSITADFNDFVDVDLLR